MLRIAEVQHDTDPDTIDKHVNACSISENIGLRQHGTVYLHIL